MRQKYKREKERISKKERQDKPLSKFDREIELKDKRHTERERQLVRKTHTKVK